MKISNKKYGVVVQCDKNKEVSQNESFYSDIERVYYVIITEVQDTYENFPIM